ncbi:hypothetical protein EVAR_41796_1 [Eumeta japonica]|uniref:Uncharacterized protein n=1 Tax=Eumeta variegata TaxID=151549 RepID=A0A4C1W0A2_EUMVA|nr:hypothetical protein EVAR_41796_1 [Eumeta japonica]
MPKSTLPSYRCYRNCGTFHEQIAAYSKSLTRNLCANAGYTLRHRGRHPALETRHRRRAPGQADAAGGPPTATAPALSNGSDLSPNFTA